MGRMEISPIEQPNDYTCGPAALKLALEIVGTRASLPRLTALCKTSSRNGTSTKNMISAIHKLGLPVLLVERATLRHLQSALRYTPATIRSVLVTYLYYVDKRDGPVLDSGHWATVSSFRTSTGRIVVFDSYSGQKKSYPWRQFRQRWIDFDLMRKRVHKRGSRFKLIRRWQPQMMLIVARDASHLPKFQTSSARLFIPSAH